MSPVFVRYEQAVYGSFPFWDKGYAILARSPGCRDEWIADLRAVCQRYGERPAGAADAGGLMAIRLSSGPWAIIAPNSQGRDDAGRPGAVSFHAIFISGTDYRRAGAYPFAFAPLFRTDWTAETKILEAESFILDVVIDPVPLPSDLPQVNRIVNALLRRRRVALELNQPIDELALTVYQSLPLSRRSRVSLATWAFGNDNRYDLVALPKLSGVALDKSYVDPDSYRDDAATEVAEPKPLLSIPRIALGLLVATLLAIAIIGVLRPQGATGIPKSIASGQPTRPEKSVDTLRPMQRRRVEEQLVSIAERFGALDASLTSDSLQVARLMTRLRDHLTYRYDYLTPEQLADFTKTSEGRRLGAWHEHLRLFAPDRPLPADFANEPLEGQLHMLAWSFHLDAGNRSADQIPAFLAESLSLPFVVRSSGLEDLDPILVAYARFLRRLPAR